MRPARLKKRMLTEEQKKWLDHLSDTDRIFIIPFDPTSEEKFSKIKKIVQGVLGSKQLVEHCGASSMRISGQDEIDVYVPVPKEKFNEVVDLIAALFGEPRSHYKLKRARFVTYIDKKHIDVFVINQEDTDWQNCVKFQSFLLSHPQSLDSYRKLKERAAGQTTREYYRKKIEFINRIINKSQ